MGDRTAISWTDATWNPVSGCSKVSPGCAHCYAEALSLRFGFTSKPWTAGNAAENVVCHPDRLDQPLRWRRPRRIFVNSMSDLFHEQVPGSFINLVWNTMLNARHHTYQVLTKRPERLRQWTEQAARAKHWPVEDIWPSWIWLGVSVEDQQRADERIPILLDTPAAVRFVSCEPLLGPVDLTPHLWRDTLNIGSAVVRMRLGELSTPAVNWVIAGGESRGPAARALVEPATRRTSGWSIGAEFHAGRETTWHPRPEALAWVRSLRDQCAGAGVAYFFKQWGGPTPTAGGHLLDGRAWRQWPDGTGGIVEEAAS